MFEITPQRVRKEEIKSLEFPHTPIEHSTETLNYLTKTVQKAIRIGKSYRRKINIVFYDNVSIKEVESVVKNSTRNHLILKNGAVIPFNRVLDITCL